MRLIDADIVVEKMTARIKEIPYGKDMKECDYARLDEEAYARTLVQNAPTIDAQPIKYGQWIDTNRVHEDGSKVYECSRCHATVAMHPRYLELGRAKYCMDCGIKMDEGKNNER